MEECIPLCWRSTSTVYEEIPSVCSQFIDSTVDVDILLVCRESCEESYSTADAACSHFDDGCTAVQAGDVNARRRLSLAVLVCDSDMHGNLEQAVG